MPAFYWKTIVDAIPPHVESHSPVSARGAFFFKKLFKTLLTLT